MCYEYSGTTGADVSVVVAAPTVPLALEVNPFADGPADALPGGEPRLVVERVVDSPVEPGDGGLGRGLIERPEPARLLGRHQAVVDGRRVLEFHGPEQVRQDG